MLSVRRDATRHKAFDWFNPVLLVTIVHTNIARSYGFALVLRPEDIATIWTLLKQEYGDMHLAVTCSEGTVFRGTELRDVTEYENPCFRRILRVGLQGDDTGGNHCIVDIAGRSGETCTVTISDEDDKRAWKVAEELKNRFKEFRPGYCWLARTSPIAVFWFLFVVYFSVEMWVSVVRTARVPHFDLNGVVPGLYLAAPFLVPLFAMMWGLQRYWSWLFPLVAFSVGRESRELEKRAKTRTWIFGGVALSIILSIASNLLTDLLTGRL